jgi:hypothetical protein
VAALGALISVLLAGCGAPAGADGDLIDDWHALPEAKPFIPEAGVCHLTSEPSSYLSSYAPVDCAKTHQSETVYVGTFTGVDADRQTPPTVGSPALRSVFAECDTKAQQFVGGDWRGARLAVQVVPPSPPGWAGGSRWYRCDIFEVDVLDGSTARKRPDNHGIERTGSLHDALKSPSPLGYGCFNEDQWGSLQPVACDKPHRFEYAGIWTAPDLSYDAFAKDPARVHAECRSVIAGYVHVPDDGNMRYRTGTTFRPPSEEWWARGDRGVRCFLWSGDRSLTRSLKAAGATALPIR